MKRFYRAIIGFFLKTLAVLGRNYFDKNTKAGVGTRTDAAFIVQIQYTPGRGLRIT